jgi:hypothetical protein
VKPGDVVTLVHGLPPTPSEPVTFVRLVDGRDRALVRTTSGADITVPCSLLDTGGPVARGPGSRVSDPDTARWAAEQAAQSLRDTQFAVLDALVRAERRGLMDHEHEELHGMGQDSAGKRRGELLALGLVADSGTKRQTPRKRRAIVWVATARGRAVWQHHQREGAA